MTTPTPSSLITCPGCGKAHEPHPDFGTWCTRACIEARLRESISSYEADVTIEKPTPKRKRKAHA